MEQTLDAYLNQIDRQLRPLSASERIDIVREIRSEMLELESQGLAPKEITGRLGSPKHLAAAYLENVIAKDSRFSWSRLGALAAFYSLTGLGGMFVLPVTVTMAVMLMLCGVLAPVAALVKLLASLVSIDLPFIVMQLGPYTPSPVMAFPIAVLMGLLLFWGGRACWRFTLWFVRTIGEKRRSLL